jgi:hypothetical protein
MISSPTALHYNHSGHDSIQTINRQCDIKYEEGICTHYIMEQVTFIFISCFKFFPAFNCMTAYSHVLIHTIIEPLFKVPVGTGGLQHFNYGKSYTDIT